MVWTLRLCLAGLAILIILTLIPIRPTVPAIQPRETTRYWTMAGGYRLAYNMVCDPANVRPEEGGGGGYCRTSANWFPDDFEDRRPKMKEFTAPVLVMQGQCDYISYAATYEYVDLFSNATYRFVEGAGHIIWWDRPEVYVETISRFLTRQSTAAPRRDSPCRRSHDLLSCLPSVTVQMPRSATQPSKADGERRCDDHRQS